MGKRLLAFFASVIVCATLLAGCESMGKQTAELVFTDVQVECTNRDESSGKRLATFKVAGTITNESWSNVNADNMPVLVANNKEAQEFKASLSQDELRRGAIGDFTYEGELEITQDETPSVSFTCDFSTDGMEDAVSELNSQLANIADEYAKKDAEAEKEREAQERANQEKAQQSLENLKGKTADQGLQAANAANFIATFVDKTGIDVTDSVGDASNKSDVHGAKITAVTVHPSTGTVTLTLDYENPEAKKAREEEEAKAEAEKKQQEDATADATEVLTIENSEDLVRLLDVEESGDPFVAEFAKQYAGRQIEFDTEVIDVQKHGTSTTRFDYLLGKDGGVRGPNFKFEDINYSDFHFTGSSPDSVTTGTKLHVVAQVVKYDSNSQLFFLKPVETSVM